LGLQLDDVTQGAACALIYHQEHCKNTKQSTQRPINMLQIKEILVDNKQTNIFVKNLTIKLVHLAKARC